MPVTVCVKSSWWPWCGRPALGAGPRLGEKNIFLGGPVLGGRVWGRGSGRLHPPHPVEPPVSFKAPNPEEDGAARLRLLQEGARPVAATPPTPAPAPLTPPTHTYTHTTNIRVKKKKQDRTAKKKKRKSITRIKEEKNGKKRTPAKK